MKEITPGRETPKIKTTLAAIGLLVLAACSPMPTVPMTPEGHMKVQPYPTESLNQMISLQSNTKTTTDWHQCATIEPGEGVINALNRTSGEKGIKEPYDFIESTIEIMDSKGQVRTYNLEELLKQNPIVQPGDKVCHTIKPILQLTATPKPEDIHR
jgi:hypothetical protein